MKVIGFIINDLPQHCSFSTDLFICFVSVVAAMGEPVLVLPVL